MRFTRRFTVLVGAILMLWVCQAQASPLNYIFTVTATTGPLAGTVSMGSFSFDSSSVTPGAFNSAGGLLTDLNFSWDGILYDATTANTGYLRFDPNGVLTDVNFGNNCSPGTCIVTAGFEQWWVSSTAFDYSVPGATTGSAGTVTLEEAPEPASVLLLLPAFAAFVVRRRHRTSQ